MKIAIPKEKTSGEKRVAITPETVKKYVQLGFDVAIETNAGQGSLILDELYNEMGAKIAESPKEILSEADVVLKVREPQDDEIGLYKKDSAIIGLFSPYNNQDILQKFAASNVCAFSMELMPRITRAQSMDVLSSQSNLMGYKAVLDAAHIYNRAMPMMMTAAGTVAPARVMIMGAGVAGLQAIATAKRLGAIVSATDVRLAVKEQVESLGAKFVSVDEHEGDDMETSGGYAKEMSDEYKAKQAKIIFETVKQQDIVICTALIPGKKAPVLITKEMVESMKPGSIIVDLAVEQGGNCPLSKLGEVVNINGVSIVGYENYPSRISKDSSSLYSRNLYNFVQLLVNQEEKKIKIDWEDEIIKGVGLTRDGKIVHPNFIGK